MAQVNLPRVRVYCAAPGTSTFSSLTRGQGSYGIAELISKGWVATGDTIDYIASNGDAFEEGEGTIDGSGNIVRSTIERSRHADGTIDTNVVNFSSGTVTIIGTFKSARVADLIVLAAKAIRADQAQSFTSGEQRQALDNLGFLPSGTKMVFVQASAPTGWTQDTSNNDKAMRIVSGSGGGAGGSVNFSTLFGRTTTDTISLNSTNVSSYTPAGSNSAPGISISGGTVGGTAGSNAQFNTGINVVSGTPQAIGATATAPSFSGTNNGGSSAAFSMGIDMRVKYVDVIVAAKN